jgi:hypothetical protein
MEAVVVVGTGPIRARLSRVAAAGDFVAIASAARTRRDGVRGAAAAADEDDDDASAGADFSSFICLSTLLPASTSLLLSLSTDIADTGDGTGADACVCDAAVAIFLSLALSRLRSDGCSELKYTAFSHSKSNASTCEWRTGSEADTDAEDDDDDDDEALLPGTVRNTDGFSLERSGLILPFVATLALAPASAPARVLSCCC